ALLAPPGAAAPTAARARALLAAGRLAHDQGEDESACRLCAESLAVARELGDDRAAARALRELGTSQIWRSPAAARPLLEEAAQLSRRLGDAWNVRFARTHVANTAFVQGDVAAARAIYEEELARARALGTEDDVGGMLEWLGNCAF